MYEGATFSATRRAGGGAPGHAASDNGGQVLPELADVPEGGRDLEEAPVPMVAAMTVAGTDGV